MIRVRRVGTLTAGCTLIASGIVFLLYTLLPQMNFLVRALRFWPVVLVALGVEVIVSSFAKSAERKYDFASVILMLLCIGFAFCCEIARQAILYCGMR